MLDELAHQDRKWHRGGGAETQEQTPELRYTILAEEVGEYARAVLENDPANARDELIQIAAVAVANIERLDFGLDQRREVAQKVGEGEVVRLVIVWCPRCGGNHGVLTFRRLQRPSGPVRLYDFSEQKFRLSLWATCPTTGEPIMTVEEAAEIYRADEPTFDKAMDRKCPFGPPDHNLSRGVHSVHPLTGELNCGVVNATQYEGLAPGHSYDPTRE